jgi:hypothetical protein
MKDALGIGGKGHLGNGVEQGLHGERRTSPATEAGHRELVMKRAPVYAVSSVFARLAINSGWIAGWHCECRPWTGSVPLSDRAMRPELNGTLLVASQLLFQTQSGV